MGSVWLCLPSKRPPEEAERVLSKWREMGYKIALWRDAAEYPSGIADYVRVGGYHGYAVSVNALASDVLSFDSACDWIVAAGDDTLPDPKKKADEIAAECSAYFKDRGMPIQHSTPTFGVMQPTGDDWRCPVRGVRLIETIAGSPWLGREWCLRANQGKGPLWPGFFHMWADECLQVVAQQLGVFWQRPDLTHHHEHWGRPRPGERIGQVSRMPAFLQRANSPKQTTADKAEFDRLKAGGFTECYPL